jgi:hypothetical protein
MASFHSGNPPFSNGDIYGIYGDDISYKECAVMSPA